MSLLKRMLQEVSTLDACASICSGLHISLRMNRMCLPTSTDEPMQTCKVKDLASFHGLILCCCRMHGTSQIRWLHGTSLGTQQKIRMHHWIPLAISSALHVHSECTVYSQNENDLQSSFTSSGSFRVPRFREFGVVSAWAYASKFIQVSLSRCCGNNCQTVEHIYVNLWVLWKTY